MGLNFEPNFNPEDVGKMVEQRLEKIQTAIIETILKPIGESFVVNARTNANFKDRTGNLRGSIGYIILKNGQRLAEDFKQGVGGITAETVAAVIAQAYPSGLALIVVAGMDYAAAVESKNYDVLTSSAIIAESQLVEEIKNINEKIARMQ